MTKTAVITGGAGGLGQALSAAFCNQGWHTVLIDLPGPHLQALADRECVSTFGCDLTNSEECANTCAQIIEDRPSIDMVIYNAGVSQISGFADSDMQAHRDLFDINYFASVDCAKHFLPALRVSQGTHLAISSVAGFAPLFHRTAYAASKHALEGFFKSLRAEELQFGVRVAIAAPSFVATNIGRSDEDAKGFVRPGSATDGIDYMTPDDAAQAILRGLDKQRNFIPVGRVATLSNLLNRLAPGLFFRQMMRRIGAHTGK
ncbi:Short-chain dehydrogenase [Aliiroseovarius halocynthiae]|uniref:SDR family NAD(P)-dependent oxidoreductase n=1 Tax=Aliiroseovarius halocynthiae TaxID=985055 RepID=A0A545SU52_9RHOB|nr:SDR family NAD(P)-dependent oxidoreductase [Aliiroseovarius halocynthiae]TQV68467.1 SDR family NAD(P)-dependent oxidoreductase [Aliiroseovarius halocynthiae]SMR70864.1 Short-chain dehydrogenase [Aliiroseovarius halocynthiae]